MEQGIEKRNSIIGYIRIWEHVTKTVNECFAALDEAEKQMNIIYDHAYIKPRYHDVNFDNPKEIIENLKIGFWKGMIEKMEVKRFMSSTAIQELDKNIDIGQGLPEITEENIFNLLQSGIQNADKMIQELIEQVYNNIRPRNDKKTNNKFQQEIGNKVIFWALEHGWSKGKFRVNHYRQDNLRDLQRAFQVLDGKGSISNSYYGELTEAINSSETGEGETEYFIFKGHKNGNLHLTFKRMDLVQKMNAMIGKNILKTA
jgi:hypothetical protein